MESTNPATILVAYEINRRDLFRVNLELAKWRLIIALLISLIFVAGVIWFFLLIDEGEILLQTSLLFIGMPLVAVGGQVLRLHATCRRFVATLPASQRQVQYLFQPETDGFDVTHGESFGHVAWNDVLQATEKPGYFVLFLNSWQARIVPKEGISLTGEVSVLRSVLRAKLGPRAKLLSE